MVSILFAKLMAIYRDKS